MSSTYYAFCHNENKILTLAYTEVRTNIINLTVIIILRDYAIKTRLKLRNLSISGSTCASYTAFVCERSAFKANVRTYVIQRGLVSLRLCTERQIQIETWGIRGLKPF